MVANRINLIVVVDDPETRSEFAARLAAHPECAVVGALASADDLAAVAAAADPDVIVWDLGEDPEAALARLSDTQSLRLPVLAIVEDDRDGVRALALGAAGLLSRAADPEQVVLAARAVLGGLLALDPAVAGVAGAPKDSDGVAGAPVETLTGREREVLKLMAEGLANKVIAGRLGISEHTAKFHVHTILGKLGTQSRTEAVVRAARLGLIAI
ncbi:MAG TPA: response regulator transcription factor [bacterium]|nr:response regulator transcription factor [bacterium]